MRHLAIATLLGVALGTVAFAGAAHARNPHCAGGIQYVVQGMNDKNKGNFEDYKRQMMKAVQQLEQCASEDPADYEAIGYLGWAYAELDSACPAGEAFRKSIAGLETKDKKKVDWAKNNLESYWATAFNSGITKITEAQAAWPEYAKAAASDADKALKAESHKKYMEAAGALQRAACLKPNDPRTMRNLGNVYVFMEQPEKAQEMYMAGLKAAPGDSALTESLHSIQALSAGSLIDKGKFDEAIAYYNDLIKSDPKNGDLHLGLAEAMFKRAQSKKGEASKPDYKLAGDAYARTAELKPGNVDALFNSALSYTNAGELPLAEKQWRAVVSAQPDNLEALSALASVLADEKKYDEAVKAIHQAVLKDPKNKTFHRQLGAIYSKAGNNPKSTEEFMVYLALQNGKAADDPAGEAKKAAPGSAAAKLASTSAPEQITMWEADGQKYQTWFYWTKNQAYHFNPAGVQLQKSDWSTAAPGAGANKK